MRSGRRRREGAVTVHLARRAWPRRADALPGTSVRVVVDASVAGADLYGGVITVERGTTIPLHWHRRGELQFVLEGRGVLLHPDGRETRVIPRSAVFSPAGRDGAHGFRNAGPGALVILFFYRAPRGRRPGFFPLKPRPAAH